jgi:hypothetical protein
MVEGVGGVLLHLERGVARRAQRDEEADRHQRRDHEFR